MTREHWRPIPDLPGYECSDHGRVRSLRSPTPRVLVAPLNSNGYPQVCLQAPDGQRTFTVHRLVAATWLGPRPLPHTGPGRVEVCHADSDRTNNHLSNLRYDTAAGNTADAIAHGSHLAVAARGVTHCPQGHPYDDANTGYSPTHGGRYVTRICKACRRARWHQRKAVTGAA